MTRIHQAADEEHNRRITDGPHHLTLVHWIKMVHLYTDIACRTGTVEHGDLGILHRLQGRPRANAQIDLGNLRQSSDACLEVLLLSFHLSLEVTGQGLVTKSRDEDGFRKYRRIGRDCIGQLVDISEDTSLQQCIDHSLAIKLRQVFTAEVYIRLLLVGFHLHAEHLSTFTTLDSRHAATHWRGKLHLGILLVHEQGIPRPDSIAFLDQDLRSHSFEVIGHKCILAARLQHEPLVRGFPLKTDVQAFV